jgi:hypothetical protein
MKASHLLVALVLLGQSVMAQTLSTASIYDGTKVSAIMGAMNYQGCQILDSWEDGNSRGADKVCADTDLSCNLHSVQYADDGSGQNSEWVYTGSCSFSVNPIKPSVKATLEKAGINTSIYR